MSEDDGSGFDVPHTFTTKNGTQFVEVTRWYRDKNPLLRSWLWLRLRYMRDIYRLTPIGTQWKPIRPHGGLLNDNERICRDNQVDTAVSAEVSAPTTVTKWQAFIRGIHAGDHHLRSG